MRQMFAIARVELTRLMRSWIAFTLLLLVPALQVILFGYAIRPQAAALTVVIAAPSPILAAATAKRLRADGGITIISERLKPGTAEASIRRGEALIGIEVPESPSMANPFVKQQPLRVFVDATNAALADGVAARIRADYWKAVAERGDADAPGPGLKIDHLYNPALRSDWTFLPALVGVTVMISMILLGCLSLAREREAGTWETLLSLPIGRARLLGGKLLPYMMLGTVQGGLVLAAGVLLFDLPVRGSMVPLLLLLPVFSAAHFLLGYAVSARARNQIEALQGAIAFYLPAMLLSGFLYPFETLPKWAQMIGTLFPLTHFIRAARGILLRGEGLSQIAGDAGAISLFLICAGGIGLALQSQRMD